jgi:hypothetical protein
MTELSLRASTCEPVVRDCEVWSVRSRRRRSQAHGARGRSPIPTRKGAGEPLAAQQEENRSDVESADHHGEDKLSKAARRRKPLTSRSRLRPQRAASHSFSSQLQYWATISCNWNRRADHSLTELPFGRTQVNDRAPKLRQQHRRSYAAWPVRYQLASSHAAVRHSQSVSRKASSWSSGRKRPGLMVGAATRDRAFSFRRMSA